MGACARCHRYLLDEHVKDYGPLCPECKAEAGAEEKARAKRGKAKEEKAECESS